MKEYWVRFSGWIRNGITVSGWLRTWQFVVISTILLLILLIIAPVKVGSIVAMATRALVLGSIAYGMMRVLYHRRLHELQADDRRWRELSIAIIIAGVCIASGAGAIG